MKIYSFFSGDTTFLTTSRNYQRIQAIGRAGYKHYIDTCKYLGEEPDVGEDYFIPAREDIAEETEKEWLRQLVKDNDVMVLDDKIFDYIKEEE